MVGMLKIGYKKLFIHNLHREYEEMRPLCVLDFFVHEKYQRKGIGQKLFDHMLKCQQTSPHLLAYDRPSHKLLNFLNKHYKLSSFTPQNCNFVVFDDYFLSQKQECIIKHASDETKEEKICAIMEPTVIDKPVKLSVELPKVPVIEKEKETNKMMVHKLARIG